MNTSYHKWLEVEVKHTFYKGEKSKDISLLPFEGTSKKMENYAILIQTKENRISFYVGINEEETFSFAEVFDGLTELNFQVVTHSPNFFNFTSIPMLNENDLYYFSNKDSQGNSGNLHSDEFVTENDTISWSQKTFMLSKSNYQPPVQIINAKNEVVQTISSEGDTDTMIVNLSSEEDGVFNIESNNNIERSVFISDHALNSYAFGVLNIDMEAMDQNQDGDSKYSINFQAREVFRQYMIVVPVSRNMNILSMEIKGKENETYEGPELTTILGGDTARVFTSNIKMALQERSNKNALLSMSYTSDTAEGIKDLEIKLPEPGTEQLRIFQTGEHEGSFFSKIIIYV